MREPALLVFDERRGCGSPRETDRKLVAEPEDGVIPAFTDRSQRKAGEIGMLFEKETPNEVNVDSELGRRLSKSQRSITYH